MTSISLDTLIPKILSSVSFHSYLLYEDYNIIENTSDNTQTAYHKTTNYFDDIVYLKSIKDREVYYSPSFEDSGDIIEFVTNRIELDESYESFEPNKNNVIEACKKLLIYLDANSQSQRKLKLDNIDSVLFEKFKKTTFTKLYKAKPIFNFDFLNKKGISQSTTQDDIFEGKIYSTEGLFFRDESLEVINTSFPLFNLNHIEVGLINMNSVVYDDIEEEIITEAKSSDIEKGFWISNNIKNHINKKTRLTLVDSPIEALAHYQVSAETRTYLSFHKRSEKTFDVIYNLIKKYNANLHLSSSISIENMIFELRLLIYFLQKKYPISFVMETNSFIDISIKHDKNIAPELKDFVERITRYNKKMINSVLQNLGNPSKRYLNNKIIKGFTIPETQNSVFKAPKTLQGIHELTKIIVKTFPSKIGIVSEKPQYINWVNMNMKHQGQNIVDLIETAEVFGFKNINY